MKIIIIMSSEGPSGSVSQETNTVLPNDNREIIDNPNQVREVSPIKVLLGAVELAQSRGAFRMSEMNLIVQAYNMLNEAQKQQEKQQES